MEKYIYDEKNGLWFKLQGDYYLPCLKLPEGEQQPVGLWGQRHLQYIKLKLPEGEQQPVGLWGQRHLQYIKQNRKVFYLNLLTSGKLNGYLSDIDKQAEEMFFRLVKQIAEHEGVTEKLKADNQMKWVAQMNNIRSRAKEVINNELIFS